MRNILTLQLIFTVCCGLANNSFSAPEPTRFEADYLKKALGIEGYNISDLNISEVSANSGSVTNDPVKCAAVIYKLYGTASQHSDKRMANLFKYDEPLPSREVLLESKEYLQTASLCHTNASVQSYAFITLATGFSGDEEIGDWLGEQYFLNDEQVHPDAYYLVIIGTGRFTGRCAKLCINDALQSQDAIKVLAGVNCIADNPGAYNDLLPDIILMARKAHILFEGLGYVKSYRDLIRALKTYGEDVYPYMKHLELMLDSCTDEISRSHIQNYLNEIRASK